MKSTCKSQSFSPRSLKADLWTDVKDTIRHDREQSLIMNARDGIQLLVNQIWSRPTRVVDDGVVAELPPISTALPREKPVRTIVL